MHRRGWKSDVGCPIGPSSRSASMRRSFKGSARWGGPGEKGLKASMVMLGQRASCCRIEETCIIVGAMGRIIIFYSDLC